MGADTQTETGGGRVPARERSSAQAWVAGLLVACVTVVVFWQVMANRSRSPLRPFELTAEDFASFEPRSPAWAARRLPVSMTPTEPNILAWMLERREPGPARLAPFSRLPVRVRLLHGYNMCDCMRMKGYTVELLADTRHIESALPAGAAALAALVPPGRQVQLWKLTSGAGDVSVYVTGMLRSGDFAETDVDVRAMAFPRIGIPDDPGWMPRGFRLSSLRHPIRNFRLLMRSKWNNARCDLLTFLRLRQPAWASEEALTLVLEWQGASIEPGGEAPATREVLAAYAYFHSELQEWRRRETARRDP